jgi:phospholipid transport system substrate-binding protein
MRDLFSKQSLAKVLSFAFFLAFLFAAAGLSAAPASAATPAEQFIAGNVQKGLTILNNTQLSKEQKRAQFRDFLLGLTDIKKIADYTLGQYRRAASPDELAAYELAFKDYALTVYQSYFTKYSGQTLQVMSSYPLGSDESVVKTVMIDPKKPNAKPLEVNFRVLSQGGAFYVVDFSVEGVWIREMERSEFTSYLGQNSGNVALLTSSLKKKSQQIK